MSIASGGTIVTTSTVDDPTFTFAPSTGGPFILKLQDTPAVTSIALTVRPLGPGWWVDVMVTQPHGGDVGVSWENVLWILGEPIVSQVADVVTPIRLFSPDGVAVYGYGYLQSAIEGGFSPGGGIAFTGGNPVVISEGAVGTHEVASAGTAQTLQPYVLNELVGVGTDACVLTAPASGPGVWFSFGYIQPASGGPATVTWFSNIDWCGGTPPLFSTVAGKSDWFLFMWSVQKAAWIGFICGQDA